MEKYYNIRKFLKPLKILMTLLLTSFSPAAFSQGQWTQKADFGGFERAYSIGFSIGTKGYLGLGENTNTTAYQDLWEYDPSNDSWTQKANYPNIFTINSVAFVINNSAYVGTGREESV